MDGIGIRVDTTDLLSAMKERGAAKSLPPEIWEEPTGAPDIKRPIRKVLLQIAQDFWNDIPHGTATLVDVLLIGSCASYWWTPSSDIDLHLVVRYEGDDGEEVLSRELHRARQTIWNEKQNPMIGTHEVEVIIQPTDEHHWDPGVYSLREDKWLLPAVPGEPPPTAPDRVVLRKAEAVLEKVRAALKAMKDEDPRRAHQMTRELKDRLRRMRRTGLERDGAGSPENLAFKALRDVGALDVLDRIHRRSYDLSVVKP